MRQWMIDPKIMCRKHLLGEHVEHHMFVGSINRKISMTGYLSKGLLEPQSLVSRHDEVAREMERRGYTHKTPLKVIEYTLPNNTINKEASLQDLINRCPECRANYELTRNL